MATVKQNDLKLHTE